jgi:ParB/RepB/Spo0J family partition protein
MNADINDLTIGLDFRLDDTPEDLVELAESIRTIGVLQPLLVRSVDGHLEVVAGRRRLAAARAAGLQEVPVQILELTDEQAADIALAENIHRRDLSAIEEALAFARMRDLGLTQTQIAARVGRSQVHVSMLLRLLELPEELQGRVHRREISYRTAIDLWGRHRTRRQGGGSGKHSKLTGDTAEIVTHWRRRHDRLLAGIAQIIKNHPRDTHEFRQQLERLFAVDRQPLPELTRKAS